MQCTDTWTDKLMNTMQAIQVLRGNLAGWGSRRRKK